MLHTNIVKSRNCLTLKSGLSLSLFWVYQGTWLPNAVPIIVFSAHSLVGHYRLGAKHDFEKNSDCETADHNYANEFMDNNTGHQFSVDHGISVDDLSQSPHYWQPQESPDAVRRDTIMSGTLYFDNFPLRWSACSRQAIHTFIEWVFSKTGLILLMSPTSRVDE